MNQWLKWLRGLFWGPAKDSRRIMLEEDVAGIKADVAALKERTAALEAFHQLAKDAER